MSFVSKDTNPVSESISQALSGLVVWLWLQSMDGWGLLDGQTDSMGQICRTVAQFAKPQPPQNQPQLSRYQSCGVFLHRTHRVILRCCIIPL